MGQDSDAATGRMLVLLSAIAFGVMCLGFAAVWSLTYGPLAG